MSKNIPVHTVSNVTQLPVRFRPFQGTVEQAKAAVADGRFPDVISVYEYVSSVIPWWKFVALEVRDEQTDLVG